ncbi:MAG: NeuD/PglB/VioB family sugar acetyltransferase [Elusimicrobiota bacterium]|nr:NeuD/PglB/VioB family sugar acetyltransferase [Elusimicrobiota bacterium]
MKPSKKKANFVLVGAGGHAKVLADLVAAEGRLILLGAVDPNPNGRGARASGLRILGNDDALTGLLARGVTQAAVAVGSVGDTTARARLRRRLLALGFETPALVHPTAIISPSATIAPGAQVMAGVIINPGASVGEGAVVNTGAIIEHDCALGEDCFVGPGAVLGGDVVVGAGAFIGLGASVRQGVEIGARARVGAGAAVVKDVRAGATVVGVPAREARRP